MPMEWTAEGGKCLKCKDEINSGWTEDKGKRVLCEPCAIETGKLGVFEKGGKHPSVRNPNLNPRLDYALSMGKNFVSFSEPLRFHEDPKEARLFSGAYLNTTNWHWSLWMKHVPSNELSELIKKQKKGNKNGKNGKR